ncbi:MAG: glycoside hydrolase family 3 C-terminal domain-containing protein [Clostridia bacterium]|nr:glycoside hydrolase family 3 C-terminal domain-containing protein [Clostridia bacterium]
MTDKEKIAQLDIEVKAELLTGGGFWHTAECRQIGLPAVKLADGPNGMRVQAKRPNHLGLGGSFPATCFPTSSAVACSFDEELCEELGERIAREAASFGVAMVLGPGLNIKRSPLCGRNFEYFSEDSYLSGKIAAAYVRGIQSTGVTACVKHFAVNSREYARMYCDSRVDEQTLRETYLTGFEIAVKEGKAGAVMSAYNRLNGEYCNQSRYLLTDVLRTEWGFDGLVVSDWGGSRGRVKALKAGADLEMPFCAISAAEVIDAVKSGELEESTVDDCVERIARFADGAQRIENKPFDKEEHAEFAARVAAESLVLLKNNNAALPLSSGERVAVIGDFAKTPRYQGAGSSQIVPTSLDNILGAIKKSPLKFIGFARGFKRAGGRSSERIRRAVRLARRADTVVLCLGLDENKESEGCDRTELSINENQIELIKKLAKLGRKIVVVLSCGSAVLTDWDVHADALLLAHLGGQSGARAVVRALTGEVNPSGRLAETYPLKEGDESCAEVYSRSPLKSDYAEGIYVGYKYFNSFGVPVKYPFGYGLSYTTFGYSDFEVDRRGVRFTVTNTGSVAGATVAQVYIRAPRANLQVAPYELKLFKKVFLQAGESRKISLDFDEYSFRVWNTEKRRFEAGGVYDVTLNDNSAHALFAGSVEITKDNLPEGCVFADGQGVKLSYKEYFESHISPDEQYVAPKKGRLQASMDMQVADLIYCKGLVAKVFGVIAKVSRHSKDKIKSVVFEWLCLRSLLQFMNFNAAQAQGFLLACDGHFFKGLRKILTKK